jgi:uncharacterized protein YjbI with pentapeptide repeats
MVESLVRWTKREEGRAKRYLVPEQTLLWEIYDLLGFGTLTQEIVEYLIGLLKKAKPDWGELFKRLESFYLDWGDGRFIDATEETLPQRKARQLKKYQTTIGQRQVDIATGLNVLILLLEIHRYAQSVDALKAQIHFYPCGQPDTAGHDDERVLRMIHYSDCLKLGTFNQSVGKFLRSAHLRSAHLRSAHLRSASLFTANLSDASLSSASLSGANLSSADLSDADLSSANLSSADLFSANLSSANLSSADLFSANLSSANLSSADLSSADLSSADLSSADLSSANLSSANLSSADLSSANLSSADLSSANLRSADLSSADLSEIRWDGATHWAGAQGLQAALNVPESLAQTPRFKAAVVLSQGMDGVKQGHVLAAIQAYQDAQTIDTGLEIDAWVWDLLCQFGSLHGQSAAVLFAGDKAVALGDWVGFRETRGIARALTDDLAGASEDFQAVVTAIEARKYYRGEEAKQRQEWLEALQMGQNPFTPEILEALRKKVGIGKDEAASEAVEENG